jgi:D-arabinose 1-dehydrogenase-like Zn-dependent alcohol dehydrogenase
MVLREFGQPLSLEELPTPKPRGAEVLLKVRAAGVCGTDLKIARGRNRRAKLPRVLCHEFAGEVLEVGPEVRHRKVGDRGVAYFYIPCGQCEFCRTGRENLCAHRQGFFGFDRDGGFAEYVALPEANLVPIPDSVPFEEAAILSDAVATSWHAVRTKANLRPSQTAVIVGLGGLGLHAVQAVRACGGVAIGVDTVASKLEAATENGAQYVVDAGQGDFAKEVMRITTGRGADAAVEFRGHPETIDPCARCLRPDGILVMVAYYDPGTPLGIEQRLIQSPEVRLTGTRGNTRQELAEVVQLVAMKELHPIVSARMALEQVNEAIDLLGTGKVIGRIVLVP